MLKIKEASVARDFETHRFMGCDGHPTARHFDTVVVVTEDGREWSLPNGRRVQDEEDGTAWAVSRYDALDMVAKVEARGAIAPEFWVELDEPESFEERFAPWGPAWQEEQAERMGWGV